MSNQELCSEMTLAEEALKRSFEALIQASNRYCATFPQSVRDGLPSFADTKSNASAAYYMYANALSYILTSVEAMLASLSPLAQKASEEMNTEIPVRCAELIDAYDAFASEALSPYFEESQQIIHASLNGIALSPLYRATQMLIRRSEEFSKRLFS